MVNLKILIPIEKRPMEMQKERWHLHRPFFQKNASLVVGVAE